MRICRIGIRNNLYYPLMLIIFILLRKIEEISMSKIMDDKSGHFVIPLLIFISQFFAGIIPIISEIYNRKKSSKDNRSYSEVELIQSKSEIIQPDNQIKIYILIVFASYFNYVGSLVRKKNTDFQLENRTRGFQIIFCAILCYFTIRINKYKHQIFSLIIIFIIIIIILAIDLIFFKKKIELLISYGYGIFSCFSRAFLDTIEKYLFEFDFLNPYKVLMLEGFIGCLFISILFFFNSTYEGINSLKNNLELIILIVLLFIYFLLTYFKNIYRVLTIKTYSPMTRALTESIVDPIEIIFQSFLQNQIIENNIKNRVLYYILISVCLLTISFLSMVYNDFIILYCWGLQYNTHLEINKRAISYENINSGLMDDDDDNVDEESNDKSELTRIN